MYYFKQIEAMILKTLIISQLFVFCLSQNFNSEQSNNDKLLYTSTNLITKVEFSQLAPKISPIQQQLISVGGPLGYQGSLGPFGPLGILGPIGSNTWNPSQLINGFEWSDLSTYWTLKGGPLSMDGPLGYKGPLNSDFFNGNKQTNNGYNQQLIGLGIFASLGPIGPLGALGPLGPLGPIGAHGFKANSDGQYINSNGKVQKEINVNYNLTSMRTYQLFEVYNSTYAKVNPSILDTSFMVQGSLGLSNSDKDKFTFTSNSDQIVSIVLVPEESLDAFKLSIYDSQQNLIDSTSDSGLIEHFVLQMKKGQKLTVEVELMNSFQIFLKDYRLIVVGSTSYLNFNNVVGNHIKKYKINSGKKNLKIQ